MKDFEKAGDSLYCNGLEFRKNGVIKGGSRAKWYYREAWKNHDETAWRYLEDMDKSRMLDDIERLKLKCGEHGSLI